MMIHEITAQAGAHKKRMRVGRGESSGHGKTCGRGTKGSGARAGGAIKVGSEGGNLPLYRRLPKRGFTNIFKKEYSIVNIGRLAELEGDTFDIDTLKKLGVVKKLQDGIKILGEGEITRPITVTAHIFSATAKQKIEAAGGKALVVGEAGSQA